MRKTKELILQTALRLFSQKGFEGVSVRDMAGELELTAPALYVHFKNKQEILEAILMRMEERDAELSSQDSVPSMSFEKAPEAYIHVEMSRLEAFTLDIFRYWTEDEFAVCFRHLLTIEQYRDERFAALFQQYLGRGVIQYLEDIFRLNFPCGDSHQMALAYFAPIPFFMGQYDVTTTKKGRAEIVLALQNHLREFMCRLPGGPITPKPTIKNIEKNA